MEKTMKKILNKMSIEEIEKVMYSNGRMLLINDGMIVGMEKISTEPTKAK